MIWQELDLNLFYTGGPPQWAYITQGDTTLGGFKFNIIYENSYWTIPNGTVFYLNGSRPDGHGFSYPCTWSEHTVECKVEDSMSEYVGEVPCTLIAYNSAGGQVGSSKVIVYVEKNPLSDIQVSGNDFVLINNVLKFMQSGVHFSYDLDTETLNGVG